MKNQAKENAKIKARRIASTFMEKVYYGNFFWKIVGKLIKNPAYENIEKMLYDKINMENLDKIKNLINHSDGILLRMMFSKNTKKFKDPQNLPNLENTALGFYDGIKNNAFPNILFATNEYYMKGYKIGREYEKKQELI